MYSISYLELAMNDMSEIIRYISVALNNKKAAINLSEKFISSIDKLADFPYSNPVYFPIRNLENEYRYLLVDNYMIFYSVDETLKIITIARVIYSKRNINNIL